MKAKAYLPSGPLAHSLPRAFSLIELLLVLGLVGLAAAWAAPAWQGQLAHQRLESAAKDLRTTWQETRLKAVEEAEAYQFAIVPGTGHWRVLPAELALHDRNASDKGGQAAHATRRERAEGFSHSVGTAGKPNDPQWERSQFGRLPDGVRFVSPRLDDGFVRNEIDRSDVAAPSADDMPSESDWVPWIVFNPRGTVSGARLMIEASEIRQRRRLTLRGLTGRVTIDAVPYPEAK